MKGQEPAIDPDSERYGVCPACGYTGEFYLLGEQIWPPDVARRLNIPEKTLLYICKNCQSTISESSIISL